MGILIITIVATIALYLHGEVVLKHIQEVKYLKGIIDEQEAIYFKLKGKHIIVRTARNYAQNRVIALENRIVELTGKTLVKRGPKFNNKNK